MSNLIPGEVWAIVLLYSHDTKVTTEVVPGTFRLLSRALSHAWDEHFLSLVEGCVRRKILRLPWDNDVAGQQSIRLQKWVIVALGRAPVEFLAEVEKIDGHFLGQPFSEHQVWERCREDQPSHHHHCVQWKRFVGNLLRLCARLDSLLDLAASSFCQSDAFQHVRCIDLSGVSLLHLGDEFLINSGIQSITFPNTLQTMGNGIFAGAKLLREIDLSATAVVAIGHYFAGWSGVESVRFPNTLESIGDKGLRNTSNLQTLDLSHTALTHIPEEFLADSAVKTVKVPPALTLISNRTFIHADATELIVVGCKSDAPTQRTPKTTLYHPPQATATVTKAPPMPRVRKEPPRRPSVSILRHVNLWNTSVITIGNDFASSDLLTEVSLPPTLECIGDRAFLNTHSLKRLDLSHTSIRVIGQCFASESAITTISLPATLRSLGRHAFSRCGSLEVLDLSQTALESLESYCGSESSLEVVMLPPTVQLLGTGSLRDTSKLRRIDLSNTKITILPKDFASGSAINQVLLPPTLVAVQDNVFRFTLNLENVDFSRTALTTIGNSFAESSGVRSVLFPSSLTTIGNDAFKKSNLEHLDLRHTHIKTIGSTVVSDSLVSQLIFPPTFQSLGLSGVSRCSESHES